MSAKKNTAVTQKENSFARLTDFNMAGVMAEELDGLDVGFERVKIPSGGSIMFEIPGENANELDTLKEFSAVILYHHAIQSYYKEKYTGGNQPPDCGSIDGVTGEGDPGGCCSSCALNKFGTRENGAKACKNRRRIYLLREGEIFPLMLSLPTGSLKEFTRYLKRLLSKGKRSNSVITRFSLKKAVNKGGIAFSQAQFTEDRVLNDTEFSLINTLSLQVKEYSKNIGFEIDDTDESIAVDEETGEIVEPLKSK